MRALNSYEQAIQQRRKEIYADQPATQSMPTGSERLRILQSDLAHYKQMVELIEAAIVEAGGEA